MKVTVIPFAHFKEHFPRPLEIELPGSTTGHDLMEELKRRFPSAGELIHASRLACEERYHSLESPVKAGRDYYLIPPVSGG